MRILPYALILAAALALAGCAGNDANENAADGSNAGGSDEGAGELNGQVTVVDEGLSGNETPDSTTTPGNATTSS